MNDLPAGLRAHLPADADCRPWLVLPYEEVGGEAYQEFALRSLNDELEIVVAAPIAGNHVFRISASDCIGVQFDTALLCSEVTVFSQQGNPIRCRYNSVGEPLVQTVLEPFLTSLFSKSANVGFSKAISENGTADLRMFTGLFSPTESYMAVEQPRKVVRSVRRLLRTTQEVLPAAGFGFSSRRVVVVEKGVSASGAITGTTITLLPLQGIRTVSSVLLAEDVLSVSIGYGTSNVYAVRFCNAGAADVIKCADDVAKALSALIDSRDDLAMQSDPQFNLNAELQAGGVTAQQELVRLTGVTLSEEEAMEALLEIHNFKWLEAERVGFDTWAVIQPQNPLRAAAVHWVRKYFKQFETGRHLPGGDHSLAS